MALRGEGLQDNDGTDATGVGASSGPLQRIVYVLHPNCAVEEF